MVMEVKNKRINNKELGMVAHTCNPSYSGRRGRRSPDLSVAQEKLAWSYLKNKIKPKRLGV
jgi:hypothetical protein